jgi:transposase InsO family protein
LPKENIDSLVDLSVPELAGRSTHLLTRALRVADVAIAPIPIIERPTLSEIRLAQTRALATLKAQGRVTTAPSTPAPSGWIGGVRVVEGTSVRQLLPSMVWATVNKKQVWVPEEDSLRLRLTVIAHFGDRGHVGAEAMASSLRATYYWPRMDELIGEVRAICIHCAGRGKTRISRPLSEMPHSCRPFQAIHADYLSLSDVEGMDSQLFMDVFTGKYLLIIRCDFTGYTRLYPCERADSATAVNAMIDWCSTFGTPEWLRTDRGKHLSEGFFKDLDEKWEAAHYMSTAYASWSNGYVERTMQVIMQTLLSLLSERRLTVKDWKPLVPMIQARLNQTPTRILGNRSPLEVVTGYAPGTVLSLIPVMSRPDGQRGAASLAAFEATQLRAIDLYITQAQEHLWALHRDLTIRQAKIRKRSRRVHNEKAARNTGANQPIMEGDYVLHLVQGGKRRSKMLYYWRGPKQVVGRVHDHTFIIKDLVSGVTSEAHDSYLRFYMDRQRGSEVDQEKLLSQYKFEETLYIPDSIIDHHLMNGLIMFVVKWRGIDEITEESLPRFYKDVPHVVNKYVKNLTNKNQRDIINEGIAKLSSA